MGEVSEKVARLSDTEILSAFREALVALYPILQRLDCITDDTQPYDPFDKIAEALWEVLVLDSLQWKHGMDQRPQLPPYGFHEEPIGPDGFIEVRAPSEVPFRFISFLGNREFGGQPFNSVEGVTPFGIPVTVAFDDRVSFSWLRANSEAGG
jgi:hypothetical protein